jgi:hypothetical protein
MKDHQQTINTTVSCSGVGVHSGKTVNLTIKPAPVNHGASASFAPIFPAHPGVSAHFKNVVDTSLATVIGAEGCIVSTVEHLMAGLTGMSIDNAIGRNRCLRAAHHGRQCGSVHGADPSGRDPPPGRVRKCYFKVNDPHPAFRKREIRSRLSGGRIQNHLYHRL